MFPKTIQNSTIEDSVDIWLESGFVFGRHQIQSRGYVINVWRGIAGCLKIVDGEVVDGYVIDHRPEMLYAGKEFSEHLSKMEMMCPEEQRIIGMLMEHISSKTI